MPSLTDAGPLLILAIILIAGMGLGWLAQRIGLPAITGQILGGVLIGRSGLALFDEQAIVGLQPLTHFALALIGVTVGAHLNLRRLRNAGRRLSLLLAAECAFIPLAVALALLTFTNVPPTAIALLGTLAISTAPATIIAVVRETRSRGVFVKTLIAAVAMNNIACILLFEIARYASRGSLTTELDPVSLLLLTIGLGAGAALITHLATLRLHQPQRLASFSVISILMTFGIASWASLSPLLACMSLGVVQTNLNPARDRLVDSVFVNFEPAILCTFFTLAGFHLSFEHALEVGVVALVFFAARIVGKLAAADVAMRLAGATARLRSSLGLSLIPQAGVAVGLVLLIQDDPAFASVRDLFVAVVLTTVTMNEILGPISTRFGLQRAGEVGQDRPRLVDFLQEENIVTGLEAGSLREAIEQLTALLISSHHLDHVDSDALLRSTLEREAQVSTCLGGGLAVPHGDLPEGLPMVGVMGLSRRGLAFDTPDGRPVHCIVLLATPRGERDRHLAVLAALARTVGADPAIQQQLYTARSPAHAYEILHDEEAEDFNYFLETDDEAPS